MMTTMMTTMMMMMMMNILCVLFLRKECGYSRVLGISTIECRRSFILLRGHPKKYLVDFFQSFPSFVKFKDNDVQHHPFLHL